MAKRTKSISFKNATIDKKNMKITEYTKDDTLEYDLLEILDQWDGIDGISLKIQQDDTIPSFNLDDEGGE